MYDDLPIPIAQYNPAIHPVQGVAGIHVGQRWREKFDSTVKTDDEGITLAYEAFLQSKYILTTLDAKDEMMHYYLYSFPSKRGAIFVQDPRNLRIVTVYEASYGYGANSDYVLFQSLVDEYNSYKEQYDPVLSSMNSQLAKLTIEKDNVANQIDSLETKLERVDADIKRCNLQKTEIQKHLNVMAHKITHTVEYNIEVLAARAANGRLSS